VQRERPEEVSLFHPLDEELLTEEIGSRLVRGRTFPRVVTVLMNLKLVTKDVLRLLFHFAHLAALKVLFTVVIIKIVLIIVVLPA
jgi:hypothetical protein